MEYSFSNIFLDKKDLLSQKGYDINSFLLENNKEQLTKIYDFYNDETKILYINGFLGTGKTDIVNYSTSFLNTDVSVLKFNCFNSTILDDILLAFFKKFRELTQRGLVEPPKIKSNNFNEKINSYLNSSQLPFLIILDSFEAILDENRQEILDFIFHILSMEKIKVIIIGRSYNDKFFEGQNISRLTTFSFERKLFDKFVKAEKIKASNNAIDILYANTRGYYFYTILTINIIKALGISLDDFLNKLKDSFLPFTKLLENEIFALVAPKATHLFWFLVLIRQDISVSLLKKLELYDEENLKRFIDNKIAVKENDNIYMRDYFEEITKNAPQNLLLRLRQYLIDIYQSQLPLKPIERDICISRQTMRKEIEYHRLFLPKRHIPSENTHTDIDMLTYSKAFEKQKNQANENEQKYQQSLKQQNNSTPKVQPTTIAVDMSQRKNVSLNLANFSTSNTNEMNINTTPSQHKSKQTLDNNSQEEHVYTLRDYISLIKSSEKIYQYSDVLELAQKALALKEDKQYKELLPFIYAKMANAYNKTAQHDKALSYYKLLVQIYKDDEDTLTQIYIKIANIFYETYKFDEAKNIYLQIVNNKNADDSLVLKSYINLINIAGEKHDNSDALTGYFSNAIQLAQKIAECTTLAELYFKYALLFDDRDEVEKAKEYYKKSIETDNTKDNKYLSSAYSNLASIALEDDNINDAITYYKQALKADEELENNEGIYDSALKLADLFRTSNPTEALNYYKKAFEAANLTKDVFYIISSSLSLGDYYLKVRKAEQAIKYYYFAYNFAQDKTSKENIEKIKLRLSDIRYAVGEKHYNELIEKLQTQNDYE